MIPEAKRLRDGGWVFEYEPRTLFITAKHPKGGHKSICEIGIPSGNDCDELGHAVADLLNGGALASDGRRSVEEMQSQRRCMLSFRDAMMLAGNISQAAMAGTNADVLGWAVGADDLSEHAADSLNAVVDLGSDNKAAT